MAIGESSYLDYLHDARQVLTQKKHACTHWSYLYDGESPLPDSVRSSSHTSSQDGGPKNESGQIDSKGKENQHPPTGFIEVGSILKSSRELRESSNDSDASKKDSKNEIVAKSADVEDAVFLSAKSRDANSQKRCNNGKGERVEREGMLQEAKLYASLESVDTFLAFLLDWNNCKSAPDLEDSGNSVMEAASLLEDMLKELEKLGSTRNSVRFSVNDSKEEDDGHPESTINVSSLSPISIREENMSNTNQSMVSSFNQSEIPINDLRSISSESENATALARATGTISSAWENVTASDIPTDPKVKLRSTHNIMSGNLLQHEGQDSSSFVNISVVPEDGEKYSNGQESRQQDVQQNSIPPSQSLSSQPPVTPSNPSAPSPLTLKKSCKKPKDFPDGFKQARFLASTPLFSSSNKQAGDHKSAVTPAEEFPPSVLPFPVPKKQLKYLNDPPNIGKH